MIRPGVRRYSSVTLKNVTIIKSQVQVFKDGSLLGDGRMCCAEASTHLQSHPFSRSPLANTGGFILEISGLKRDSQTSHLTKVTGVVAKPTEQHLVLSYKELKSSQRGFRILSEDLFYCSNNYLASIPTPRN